MAIVKLHERGGSAVEGTLREHLCKNGVCHDLVAVGILARERHEMKPTIEYDKYEIEEPVVFFQTIGGLSQ
jgi:hypothetical protein